MGNQKLSKRISYPGLILTLIIFLSLFGPWVTLSYDSYVVLNPITKLGEKHYHSRMELSPFYVSILKDGQLETRFLLVSVGTTVAGIIFVAVAVASMFKYRIGWISFLNFFGFITGLFVFFLSLGRGISIGVFTKSGWGMILSFFGLLWSFFLAFINMTSNRVSRHIDS